MGELVGHQTDFIKAREKEKEERADDKNGAVASLVLVDRNILRQKILSACFVFLRAKRGPQTFFLSY